MEKNNLEIPKFFIHIFKENSVTFPEYYEKASDSCSVR
jgi:hypothetical protein